MKTYDMKYPNNVAGGKGVLYVLSWIGQVLAFVSLFVCGFLVLGGLMWMWKDASITKHLLDTAILLIIMMLLMFYLKTDPGSRGLHRLVKGMRRDGFFIPEQEDQHYALMPRMYIGIDFKTGIVGIASVYKSGVNRKKRIYFDTDVIESFESVGSKLILNLRNKELPVVEVLTVNPMKAYRHIEMACNMRAKFNANRGAQYQAVKAKMLSAGWMIDRDY
ncbi:hypothetical protein [Serratia quinivorans]|uniref:hypothetical protein n=1 Tax=Serratia quinivorans TaxID=137545 RepID=UPI0034C620EC